MTFGAGTSASADISVTCHLTVPLVSFDANHITKKGMLHLRLS